MARKTEASFASFVLDQLSGLDGLVCRAMFGGHGLYQKERFFGILWRGRLYFKTDARTVEMYRTRGMKPFQPNARQTLTSYYEVPVDIVEDAEQLIEWAQAAVAAQAGRSRRLPEAFRIVPRSDARRHARRNASGIQSRRSQ